VLSYGLRSAAVAAERGSMIFKSIVFPEWWVLALVPVGMGLLAVEFARLLRRNWRARGSGPLDNAALR
jgi:TRAP-type C4-dicarboxylate transport system permease small subunit